VFKICNFVICNCTDALSKLLNYPITKLLNLAILRFAQDDASGLTLVAFGDSPTPAKRRHFAPVLPTFFFKRSPT